MKLEIYGEQQEKLEQIVRLRLEKSEDAISVIAVKENGNRISWGHLMKFLPSGQIHFSQLINPDLGFDLDKDGRIKIQ